MANLKRSQYDECPLFTLQMKDDLWKKPG
jgi:hypothetical protein